MYMESQYTFYITYRIENDAAMNGMHLPAGHYKYMYDMEGSELPTPCQFSPDGLRWSECKMFNSLEEFKEFFDGIDPTPMKMEREDYVETIHYRGISIPIFCDDYGQCFYCIFNGKVLSFGTFQTEYADDVRTLIDHEIGKRQNMNVGAD